MTNRKIIEIFGISAIFLLCALSVVAVSAERLTETIEKTAEFVSGGNIGLTTRNGFIHVESWQEERVSVTAQVTIRAENREIAEDVMKEIELILDRSGNSLDIRVDIPRLKEFQGGGGFLSWLIGENKPRVTANLTVRLPYETSVNARSTNGEIRIDKLEGDVDLKTTNGKIDIGPVKGNAGLKSTNGGIIAREVSGLINAQTTNGGIDVSMNREGIANEPIDCHTTNGGISLVVPKDLGTDVTLRTTNGSIHARLNATHNANVTLSTSNGSIETDFPVTIEGKISKKRMQGVIGEGGNNIIVRTTNGKISLEKIQ